MLGFAKKKAATKTATCVLLHHDQAPAAVVVEAGSAQLALGVEAPRACNKSRLATPEGIRPHPFGGQIFIQIAVR